MEVTVEPVNDAPVAAADMAQTLEDTEVAIDVLANDTDADGDALRIESVTSPANGTARITGSTITYAPDADWHGTDRFTYTVTDGQGGTAEAPVEVTVQPVNDAPVVLAAIPDQALEEGGVSAELDLGPYFQDPDGDRLGYAARSSDAAVAGVSVVGTVLTLTPAAYGQATIEVTATGPGGLSATQAFDVGVGDRMVRLALDETLAGVARAHLASARMTLSRYVDPAGAPGPSRLMIMGVTIPLDEGVTRDAAGRLLGQPGAFAGLGRGGGSTEFVYQWGDGGGGGARTWRFWSQGDIQTYAAGTGATGGSNEGDLRSGWAGIDRSLGDRWLTGLAIARSSGAGDWRHGKASGALETTMTAAYPYLSWSDGQASVWAMGGVGWGTAKNMRSGGRVGDSDLTLGLGLLEVRRSLSGWFGLRADAGSARLETATGAETVDGRGASVDQQRLGIELSRSMRNAGLALHASAWRDGGDGQTGTGLELAGGIRAARGPVRIDVQGRILALHTADGYEERGLGVTLTLGSPAAEGGPSLSVTSRWGGSAAATGALWQRGLYGPRPDAAGAPWSLDMAVRWGLGFPDRK